MVSAKDISVKPISAKDAARIIDALHYSGTHCQNSRLHLGVFVGDRCGGAMSFGCSIDKRRMLGIVSGTKWNEFIELNRMAFADWLPRNSESRAIGYAMRTLKKEFPWLKWVVSFADATQCGDGTIYRASGFILTQIKRNTTMLRMPDGTIVADKTLNNKIVGSTSASSQAKRNGAKPLTGFQLRYIYFLHKSERVNLACKEVPFSEIASTGASMYLGKPRARSVDSGTACDQHERCGANPTRALHYDEA